MKKIRLAHRWLGRFAALFIILLVLSGLALNHAHQLKLDQYKIRSDWILIYYGLAPAQLKKSLSLADHDISQFENTIFFDDRPIAKGEWLGAWSFDDHFILLTEHSAFLFDLNGLLIEEQPLPEKIEKAALKQGHLWIQGRFYWQNDSDLSQWQKVPARPLADFQFEHHLPSERIKKIQSQLSPLSWQRFLLDLHSGRLLGAYGVYWMDLIAFILIGLALSGWWQSRRKGRKKSSIIRPV